MEPVYVDVHIHTSENPDSLNQNYDIDTVNKSLKYKTTTILLTGYTMSLFQ